MKIELDKLPSEVRNVIIEQGFMITQLKNELAQLKRMIFGSKSERFIPSDPGQLVLALGDQPEPVEVETVVVDQHERRKTKKEKHPVRQLLPESLQREIITIYPEGYDENSPEKPIGKEITEVLEEIPGKFYVKRYERLKFAKAGNIGVVIGSLPSRPIDKGLFGELLLTRIIVDKYCDHLPLYRQQQRFQRAGIKLAYSTIADVPKQVCKLLELLYKELIKQVLTSGYIQVDETPHPVLDSNVKEKTHRGYLWVYRSVEPRLVLFDYHQGRSKIFPEKMLKDFQGFLQTDGYSGYDKLGLKPGITAVGCMAHGRRYFEKALKEHTEFAPHYMKEIQKVYAVEREIREGNLSDDEIIKIRKEKALPILVKLESWLKENIYNVTPESLTGKAFAYNLSRWSKLIEYINHPFLEIDNNLVENAIRPTVLGRKNYLFSGSHEGAERSAMIYSFLGSCKMNNINPSEWLADVLLRIQDSKVSELHMLLPNRWTKA